MPTSKSDLSPLVDIAGYTLGERVEPGIMWTLGEGTEGAFQSIFVDGIWVGIVATVHMPDASTDEAWASFVDAHHADLLILTHQPALGSDGTFVAVSENDVPAWEVFGFEPVLHAQSGDMWAGLWHHGNEVWGVSGDQRARMYASQLALAQQSADTQVVEPEQADIDALEGPLGTLFADSEDFTVVDWPHANTVGALAQWGECVDHIAGHWIHPAADSGAVTEFDDRDLDVLAGLWSELCAPFSLESLMAGNPAFELTELNGQPAATDGTTWVATVGNVVVEIRAADSEMLDAFAPMLTHLIETAATLT